MTGFWKIASCALMAGLVGTSVACGSDDGGDSGDPLTCESLTLCSYAEVTNYHIASIPAPQGGTIADGQYRLAWVETTEQALEHFLKACTLHGDVFEILFQTGKLRLEMGDPPAARPLLERAVRLRPRSGNSQRLLGDCYLEKEEQAKAALTRLGLRSLDPSDPGR